MSLLTVDGLSIGTRAGGPLVRDLTIDVGVGEIVGIVGESGSGKTLSALALMGLLPAGVEATAGTATLDRTAYLVDGRLVERPDASMIFQNPTAALNPTMRIRAQLARQQHHLRRVGLPTAAPEAMLDAVGIHDIPRVLQSYPHQLSGGMNQRVMIAMALAMSPKLLIADEPTTGLDVTVQAQILELLQSTVATTGVGVLIVSHDLGVIAQLCDRVAVMKLGEIREFADVDAVFHAPTDEYTKELLASSRATGEAGV